MIYYFCFVSSTRKVEMTPNLMARKMAAMHPKKTTSGEKQKKGKTRTNLCPGMTKAHLPTTKREDSTHGRIECSVNFVLLKHGCKVRGVVCLLR